ncbi:hypothetical protein B0H15DRAFT_1025506 [Mycena belliarum]|uniref:Uncharacterized protein n=2 Tax=Mycena belliarum TaxID=1033014 RepID=A0AAD6TZG5_9AGAR|nr:hypothetical protein B0H15DRAFT_1025506 [Mycena belliae]
MKSNRGQGPRRMPPGPSTSVPSSEPRRLPPGPVAASSSSASFTSNLGAPPEFHNGPYRLVPLGILTQQEKGTLTPTAHFHGIVRNDEGVFLVFNANRTALLDIPRRQGSNTSGTLNTTTWTRVSASHFAFAPLYPVYDGALLRVFSVSRRSTSTESEVVDGKTYWTLGRAVVEQWTSLEGLLSTVLNCMSSQVDKIYPEQYRARAGPPSFYGYTDTYLSEDELFKAVSLSRDAFIAVLAAIAMHFLILDGSPQRDNWRSAVGKAARVPFRLMDSLEDAVGLILRCPTGMIVDASDSLIRDIGWLFSLLLNGEVKLHKEVLTLAGLPPSPVKMTEYVYIKSTFRRWGVLPNPDYFATVEPQLQFPPVERHSGQSEGQSYIEFFARREERNKAKLAAETPENRQKRLSRLQAAEKQHCPSAKKGARVYIWEKINDFWVRKLLQRNEVEDEWGDFAPSQRIFDPFKNEWDLCEPLDPHATVPCDDDDDDTTFEPPPTEQLPVEVPSVTISAEAHSALDDASAALQYVDTYFEENDNHTDTYSREATLENVVANFTFKDTLECRVGLVDAPGATFPPDQLSRAEVCARFLGDKTQSAVALGNAALALVHSLLKAKKVQDMPPHLFDLCDPDAVREIWNNSGIIIEIFEKVSALKHRSTAYLLKPRVESARLIVVYSAATAMHLARLQCASWSDIVSQLHALGAPFEIVVKQSGFAPSSYDPSLRRCDNLGVRPEDYKPDKHDLRNTRCIIPPNPSALAQVEAWYGVDDVARQQLDDPHLPSRDKRLSLR